MIIPIRCFTCGNLVADKWDEFLQLKEQEVPEAEIFKKLDLPRYCCRRMLIGQDPFDIERLTELLGGDLSGTKLAALIIDGMLR